MIEQFSMDFRFPTDEEDFLVVEDLKDLKSKIKKAKSLDNISRVYFHVSQPKENYLYAYCSACKSKIKYKKHQDSYRLVLFSNHHSHQPNSSNQSQLILDYIAQLPLSISLMNKKALIKQQFGINDRKFYYLHSKASHLTTDFHELAQKLDKEKYQSRYKPFPLPPKVIPDVFVTSSPTMRQNYRKYGQFISLDVTYNLIKEKVNGVGWGICLILGMNSHQHIVPFALAIMNSESESTFSELFLSFFEMMGREPDTILSDEQISIKSSLSKLQENGSWSGTHLLDKFHILKNIKKKVKDSRQIFTSLKNAIVQKTQFGFQQEIEKAYNYVSNQFQAKVIKDFLDKSSRFCLSQAPNTFFGTSISTSFGQKANDIVKSYLQFEKPAIQCMKSLIKIAKVLQQNALKYKLSKIKYEDLMQDPQIRMIRHQYCEQIFELFMKNYVESLKLRLEVIDEGSWKLVNATKPPERVEVNLRYGAFYCSCGMQIKQGIPCSHLLSLCRQFSEDYSKYFHQRWKISIKDDTSKKQRYHSEQKIAIKRGRPRYSRRNVL